MLRLLKWGFLPLLAGVIGLAGVVVWYGRDLPEVANIYEIKRRPQVVILDASGAQLAAYGDLYGEPVKLYDLPPHVFRAVLAIEDRRFYRHFGLDVLGLARAAIVNAVSGRIRQGGSTITQQLAKVAFLTPERSVGRKIKEALLALSIERRFTKDEILSFYLNRVYFGSGAYGIEAASRRYFGRRAADLSLHQAALLAGLLRAPTRLSPHASRERAEQRAETVLDAMIDAGFVTARAAQAARHAKSPVVAPAETAGRRYFTDWIVDLLPNYVVVGQHDLVVRTSLSQTLQELAETQVNAALEREGAAGGVRQAAFVAMAPDGAVRAMVGGADYRETQFNRAVQARRQPGSTFKLFVLLAALEGGAKPGDRYRDAPLTVAGWTPRNFGDRYWGDVALTDAIAHSLNSVAVRVAEDTGRARVAAMARRLGIKSPIGSEPSVALGTSETSLLELTGAFAVLANRGRSAEPYAITEIRTRKGESVFRRQSRPPARLIDEAVAQDAHAILNAVTVRGTARGANLVQPAYGKTGTSQDHRDAWFIGYTSDLVAGAWLGNDDRAPMREMTGGALPARLWGGFMAAASRGRTLVRLETAADAAPRPPRDAVPSGR